MSSRQQYPTPNYARVPGAAPVRWYRTEGPAKALRVLMVLTIIALGLLAIAYAVDHRRTPATTSATVRWTPSRTPMPSSASPAC